LKLALEAGSLTYSLAQKYQITGVPIEAQELIEKGVKATLEPLNQYGLTPVQIGAFALNPLHPDPKEVAEQTEQVSKIIELAPETGCNTIVISCGNYRKDTYGAIDRRNRTQEAIHRYADIIAPLLEKAEKYSACISIEAYIKGIIYGPESFLTLSKILKSKALRCNLDVTSLYDLNDFIDPKPLWLNVCAKLKGHIGIVHIKDVSLSDGFHIHANLSPITEGVTDWKFALDLIEKTIPEQCWVMLEHVQNAEEAKKSIGFLRKLTEGLQLP